MTKLQLPKVITMIAITGVRIENPETEGIRIEDDGRITIMGCFINVENGGYIRILAE